LGSEVEYIQESVYHLSRTLDRQFDRVFMPGVLYHLKHPLWALEELKKATQDGGSIYLEGECWLQYAETLDGKTSEGNGGNLLELTDSNIPVCLSYPGTFKKGTNWFIPNLACLKSWFQASGLLIGNFKVHRNRYPDQRYVCRLIKAIDETTEEHPVYSKEGAVTNPCVIDRRAAFYRELGEEENARHLYRQGISCLTQKLSKDALDWYRLGSFHQKLENYFEAAQCFETVLRMHSNGDTLNLRSGSCFHLGEICHSLGNIPAAGKYFHECLELDPGHRKARSHCEKI